MGTSAPSADLPAVGGGAADPDWTGRARPVRAGSRRGGRGIRPAGQAWPRAQRSLQRRGCLRESRPCPTCPTASVMRRRWAPLPNSSRRRARRSSTTSRSRTPTPCHAGAVLRVAAQDRSAGEQLDARDDKQADQEDHGSGARQQRKSDASRRADGDDRWHDPRVPSSRWGRNHLGHLGRDHLGEFGSRIARAPHPGHDDLAGSIERPLVGDCRHRGDDRSDRRPHDRAVRAERGPHHSGGDRRPRPSDNLADRQARLRRGGGWRVRRAAS